MCIRSYEDGKTPCQVLYRAYIISINSISLLEGDSGGPLANLDLNRRTLLGVISFGSRICGSPKPAGVARIDEDILRWIRGIVPDIIVM